MPKQGCQYHLASPSGTEIHTYEFGALNSNLSIHFYSFYSIQFLGISHCLSSFHTFRSKLCFIALLPLEVHIYRQSVNMGPTSMSEIEVNKIIEAPECVSCCLAMLNNGWQCLNAFFLAETTSKSFPSIDSGNQVRNFTTSCPMYGG